MSAIAAAIVCVVIDINSNCILLPCPRFTFAQNVVIYNLFVVVIASYEYVPYSCEAKEIYLAWEGQKLRHKRQKRNASIAAQAAEIYHSLTHSLLRLTS